MTPNNSGSPKKDRNDQSAGSADVQPPAVRQSVILVADDDVLVRNLVDGETLQARVRAILGVPVLPEAR
jgi:hypothetical protein